MRLLHVINSMIVGGAETLLRDVIIEINKSYPDIEQHVVTLYGGGHQIQFIKDLVIHTELGVKKINFFSKAYALNKYITNHKIDVIHAHLYDAMILARIAAPKKVKLFYTYHTGIYLRDSKEYSSARKWIDKLTYKKNHEIIFVSNYVKNCILNVLKVNQKNTHVLPNFVSRSFHVSYKFNPKKELKLISVGNLRFVKNQKLLISTLAELKNFDISLDIYGNGNLENELQQLINKTKARVKIITKTQITSELLSNYDLFFMSSIHEGMSVSLIEAMASGLPSLLSDIESFKETAKDSALYFNLDFPSQAKDKLLEIYENKSTLSSLSQRSLELSKNHSLDTYIKNLMKIYVQKNPKNPPIESIKS